MSASFNQPLYHAHTLPCGLRIIHEPSASPVLYCGYVLLTGTRHEDEADSGMAHFIEHLSFKGTTHRRACHIVNGLERVGGDLNAYTTKQETVYYATVLKDDFKRAADLLTDIVFHSTFPQAEIDKEVEVICDEIDSYKDSPSEIIFDEFESLMYPGQPWAATFWAMPSDCVSTPQPMPCVSPIVTIIRKMPCSMCMATYPLRKLFAPSNVCFHPPILPHSPHQPCLQSPLSRK